MPRAPAPHRCDGPASRADVRSAPWTDAAPWRAIAGLAGLALLVTVVALPVLAADPSGSPVTPDASPSMAPATVEPSASPSAPAEPLAEPEASDEDEPEASDEAKPAKPDKAKAHDDEAESDVSVTGKVAAKADADGEPGYTLTSGTTVHTLDAGPPWYWGDHNPLAAVRRQDRHGRRRAGDRQRRARCPVGRRQRHPGHGKPPWAGGWKVVGKIHPGWSQEKSDRWPAKHAAKKAIRRSGRRLCDATGRPSSSRAGRSGGN